MPSVANNNPEYHWPQLQTSLRDHAQMKRQTAETRKEAYGKAFKVTEPLDPAVRKNGFVKCKLSSTKKAGIISNQKASCATAWLAANHGNDFADAGHAWTGLLTKPQLILACPFHQMPEDLLLKVSHTYRAYVSAGTTYEATNLQVFKSWCSGHRLSLSYSPAEE